MRKLNYLIALIVIAVFILVSCSPPPTPEAPAEEPPQEEGQVALVTGADPRGRGSGWFPMAGRRRGRGAKDEAALEQAVLDLFREQPRRGFKLKEIYSLFPSGPAQGACKVAGLPKPTGCV